MADTPLISTPSIRVTTDSTVTRPSIAEIERVLRGAGLPCVGQGEIIPPGLSFKVLPGAGDSGPSLRLFYMHHGREQRVTVDIDCERYVERVEVVTRG